MDPVIGVPPSGRNSEVLGVDISMEGTVPPGAAAEDAEPSVYYLKVYKRRGVLSQLLDLRHPSSSLRRVVYDEKRDGGKGVWISYIDNRCVAVQKTYGGCCPELVYSCVENPQTTRTLSCRAQSHDRQKQQQLRDQLCVQQEPEQSSNQLPGVPPPPSLPKLPITVYTRGRLVSVIDCAEGAGSPRRLVYDAVRDHGRHFMVTYCDGRCVLVMNDTNDIIYRSDRC